MIKILMPLAAVCDLASAGSALCRGFIGAAEASSGNAWVLSAVLGTVMLSLETARRITEPGESKYDI